MNRRDQVKRDLVRQWLGHAREDLRAAGILVKQPGCLNASCFHAQQAAEKSLKAFLVQHQVSFPRTHAIGELLDLMATVDASLAESLSETTALSPYSVEMRYPTDQPDVTAEKAAIAVRLARRAYRSITSVLRPSPVQSRKRATD